jgi:hypothetical protein
MSGISVGATEIVGISVGAIEVVGVSLGSVEIWTSGSPEPDIEREPAEGENYKYTIPNAYFWELFSGVLLSIRWNSVNITPGAVFIGPDDTEWIDTTSGWTYHRGTYHSDDDAYGVYRTRPATMMTADT